MIKLNRLDRLTKQMRRGVGADAALGAYAAAGQRMPLPQKHINRTR